MATYCWGYDCWLVAKTVRFYSSQRSLKYRKWQLAQYCTVYSNIAFTRHKMIWNGSDIFFTLIRIRILSLWESGSLSFFGVSLFKICSFIWERGCVRNCRHYFTDFFFSSLMKTIDKLLYQCTLTRVTGIEFIKFQLWDSLFFKCPPRHKTYILRNTHRYTDRICSKNAGAPNLYVCIFALVIVANIQCRSAVVASLQAFYARIDAAIKRVLHFRIRYFSTLSCSPFADWINIKLYKN